MLMAFYLSRDSVFVNKALSQHCWPLCTHPSHVFIVWSQRSSCLNHKAPHDHVDGVLFIVLFITWLSVCKQTAVPLVSWLSKRQIISLRFEKHFFSFFNGRKRRRNLLSVVDLKSDVMGQVMFCKQCKWCRDFDCIYYNVPKFDQSNISHSNDIEIILFTSCGIDVKCHKFTY